jgi:hypothetical protein
MPNPKPNTKGLRPNPHRLGVELLKEDEVSATFRIRTKASVHGWLKGLGAKKIGELLERAYEEAREKP